MMKRDRTREHEKDLELLARLGRVMLPQGFNIIDYGPEKLPTLIQLNPDGPPGPLHIILIQDPIIRELARQAIRAGIGANIIPPRSISFQLDSAGLEKIELIPQDHGTAYPAFMDMHIWYNTLNNAGTFAALGYQKADIIAGLWQYLNGQNDFVFKCVKYWNWPGLFEQVPQEVPETFAFSSLPIMFTFLPLFSGTPENIPRFIFNKRFKGLEEDEQKTADKILDSLFMEPIEKIGPGGDTQEVTHYIIAQDVKIKATGYFDLGLFTDDLAEQEKMLAMTLKKGFKAEGMRHFLAFNIALEENFRKGLFYWNVNDQLRRLGLKRKKSGAYDKEARTIATDIFKFFMSIFLTAYEQAGDKGQGRGVFTALKLFNVEGVRAETFNNKVIDESVLVRANELWYGDAFTKDKTRGYQYTQVLKRLVKVDPRIHPYVYYMAPRFAVLWRLNPKRKLKVTSLLKICGLDQTQEGITKLESELDFMIKDGHLGEWVNEGKERKPSQCPKPFDCVISLNPPEWFTKKMEGIRARREAIKSAEPPQAITPETIQNLKEKFGLSNKKLALEIGTTPQQIGRILSGKQRITGEMAGKVLRCDRFREYLKSQAGQ